MNEYVEIQIADDEPLQVGDRVDITWDIYQGGDWFVGFQIGKIERAFEADGRVKLLSYFYDEPNMQLTLRCEVIQGGSSAPPALAAGLAPLAIIAIAVIGIVMIAIGASWAFLYEKSRSHRVYRKAPAAVQEALDDPNTAPEVKEVLQAGLEAQEETWPDALGKLAVAAVVIAVALIVVSMFGD